MIAMKKCLLLINTSGGNAKKAMNKKLLFRLSSIYDVVDEVRISVKDGVFDIAKPCKGYDALCISGGDGTLNSAINSLKDLHIDFLYHPCGTVNDFARSLKSINASGRQAVDLGGFNGFLFSYVAATGTFTPIGYGTKSRQKKIFKKFAYWFSALKMFRSHKINAKIDIGGKLLEGTYTLIMAVKSKCVFGFNFNKRYKHNSGKGHLLLIKTPTGAFKFFKLFFRFFRAFFVGFKKEKNSKNIKFLEFSELAIDLNEEQSFCIDGEKHISQKHNIVKIHKEKLNVTLI